MIRLKIYLTKSWLYPMKLSGPLKDPWTLLIHGFYLTNCKILLILSILLMIKENRMTRSSLEVFSRI